MAESSTRQSNPCAPSRPTSSAAKWRSTGRMCTSGIGITRFGSGATGKRFSCSTGFQPVPQRARPLGHGLKTRATTASLPNDLHQHPLLPSPVKLRVKDLLPRPKVQLAIRNRNDDFASHELALHVGVGVV